MSSDEDAEIQALLDAFKDENTMNSQFERIPELDCMFQLDFWMQCTCKLLSLNSLYDQPWATKYRVFIDLDMLQTVINGFMGCNGVFIIL